MTATNLTGTTRPPDMPGRSLKDNKGSPAGARSVLPRTPRLVAAAATSIVNSITEPEYRV